MYGDSNDLVVRSWESARESVDFRGRTQALGMMAEGSPEARAVLVKADELLGDFAVELLRSFVAELGQDLAGPFCESLLDLEEERVRA